MEQKALSRWLKAVIIVVGLCGLGVYCYIFPVWGKSLAMSDASLNGYYWPWLIFLWITAIPCYFVLGYGWRIASEIGKDNTFSYQNAADFKRISQLAVFDSAIFFVGNVILLVLNISHGSVALASLMIVFAGIAVAIVAAALSHFVLKAAKLREENELTI